MPIHRIFFFLTILLLPTQLGKHFFPDWALVLGRRIDYLSPTIFLTDITIVLTLVSWLFSQTKKLSAFSHQLSDLMPRYWKLICVFLFIGLNILFSTSPIVSFYKWLKVLEFVLFGWYIVKSKPSYSFCLTVLCLPVFYSSLIAIAQFFLQHSIGGPLWFLGERTFDITTPGIATVQILPISILNLKFNILNTSEVLRAYATFPHPNVLGGFLAVTLPLLLTQSTNLQIYKSTN